MFVVKYKKIWFALSAVLFAASIWAMTQYGFRLSIDFKGGAITEVRYNTPRPDKATIEANIFKMDLGGFSLRPSENDRFVIRTKELTPAEKNRLAIALGGPADKYVIERSNSVGPIAGAELQSKAVKAISVVILMIVIFVTFAFRGVSRPVASWKYGLATIIALLHDVVIPTGIFVYLGHALGIEIDLLFVTGLLAILGYSVHDTIVVFDRIRENLTLKQVNNPEEFERTIGQSVSQTFGRSINTSLTIFITLLALYIYGAAATKTFALLLIVGLIAGTYSSIFIASPLLILFYNWQKKTK